METIRSSPYVVLILITFVLLLYIDSMFAVYLRNTVTIFRNARLFWLTLAMVATEIIIAMVLYALFC
jgi:hypothetical protein